MTVPDLLHGCTSEADLLVHALSRFPDRVAFRVGDRAISYREVAAKISGYCQALSAMGVGRGHRLGLLSGNRIEVFYVSAASNILGCCLVPLHPKGSLKDHAYVARDAGLGTLVFEAGGGYEARAQELRDLGVGALAALGASPHAPDLIAAAEAFAPAPLRPVVLAADETCRLSYSGGTTGEPKAIEGTPRTLLTKTMIQLVEWDWPQDIRQLVCAPLSHAGGSMVLPTLVRGGTLFVLGGFDPAEVLQTIARERITCVLLVPTMINALLDHPEIDRFDLTSLEAIYYGASPISPARLRQGIARFGQVFFQFYGQTEAPMTVCVLRRDEHDPDDAERLASCGRPVPWVRVALLDDDGQEVADGAPGEICVQGPLVMKGYLNKPEETAKALAGGWLHSGDVAVRNADGLLRIVDRKKDMIISGGFNVFAREVEDVLAEHPAVAACAVIGVPDPRWGEAVKALVVARPGTSVSERELIELVKQQKGPVQAPKLVEFIAEMPLTGLGKPDKKQLREREAAAPALRRAQ
jgi:fatty-acyl-CoA synthase